MARYLLAHDIGTSGNKATLFTTGGLLVKSVTSSYEAHFFNSTWAEQNPDDWWRAVCESSSALVQGIDPAEIAAVSFSGQMMGCVCVDRAGVPLRPAIIWADMRATGEVAFLRSRIDPWDLYTTVGHRISSSYTLPKLMWVKKNEPEIFGRTYKVLNAKDFIVHKMTGRFVTDHSDASGTLAFDLSASAWSDRILEAAEIDQGFFPTVVPSTHVAGGMHRQAAEACGLNAGTPVVVGGGDGLCASVGAGSVSEGVTYTCLGSSAWIASTTKEPVFDAQMRTFTFAHMVPGLVGPCGTMQAAGASFTWAKNEICKMEQETSRKTGDSIYEIINREIESSSPGANGLLFLPYLLGERSPWWNADARGAFVGLKMEHQRSDMLRAVLEGIALNLRLILDVMRSGIAVNEMILIGGMAQGRIERQILADSYGVPVKQLNHLEEATSMGAAVAAGVGVGELPGFDAIDRFVAIDNTLEPDAVSSRVYEEMLPIFSRAYTSLESLYSDLARI